jgi:hypothetical protein
MMKKIIPTVLVVLSGTIFTHEVYSQTGCVGKILFVSIDPGGYGDSTVALHLKEDLGYTVDVFPPEDLVVEDAITYDIIIISSTPSSTDAAMFRDVEVPVLSMENHALDEELGMVQAREDAGYNTYGVAPYVGDNENSFDSLMVVAGDSVTAIGLDAGYGGKTIRVFTDDVPYGNNRHPGQYGVPNENAYLILQYKQETLDLLMAEDFTFCGDNGGDFCENPRYAAFAYPKGAEMGYDNMPAPDKRSFYFFHDYSAAVATDEAWEIFNALVYWSNGCLDRPDISSIRTLANPAIDLQLYPNPTDDYVNLKLDNLAEDVYQIDVYDIIGKKVFEQKIYYKNKIRCKIPLGSSGVYLLKVTSQKSLQSQRMKIVKR